MYLSATTNNDKSQSSSDSGNTSSPLLRKSRLISYQWFVYHQRSLRNRKGIDDVSKQGEQTEDVVLLQHDFLSHAFLRLRSATLEREHGFGPTWKPALSIARKYSLCFTSLSLSILQVPLCPASLIGTFSFLSVCDWRAAAEFKLLLTWSTHLKDSGWTVLAAFWFFLFRVIMKCGIDRE